MIREILIQSVKEKAQNILPELIEIRRHLHVHPELSFEEKETVRFVSDTLKKYGISNQQFIAGTGLVALIEGKNPGKKCVALRADMDALPIQEMNEVSYKSVNDGVMHACGHDVHTTALLGAAKILQELKDNIEGCVKLIFQPGEEKSPGGASLMIADGALENPAPDYIFGLHVDPSLPSGHLGFRQGQYMASADEVHIKIIGKGGHAALPHLAIDPIAIAAQIISALQQIISRKANPLTPSVLSFGKIQGGHATNVIAEEVVLLGTFRTQDESWRETAKKLIRETTESIAWSQGAKAEINFPPGYPSVFNDVELTQKAIAAAREALGVGQIHHLDLRMTAEDFSFYSQKIPACFYRLGTNKNNEQFTHPVHTPYFDIDETALSTGAFMMSIFGIMNV